MASKICWLLLVMLLSIATFGFSMCCVILISMLIFITGILVMTFSVKIPAGSKHIVHFPSINCQYSSPFFGIPKVILLSSKFFRLQKINQQLTGSKEIDAPLNEIISNITRDFIQSWYQEVSLDTDFIDDYKELCRKVINNFSNCAKDVNWVSFFTKRVVEDFTSHMRLFRHAETTFRRKCKENPDDHPSIEKVFFEKESNHEKTISREDVCCSSEHEADYLQSICDILLYLLLPPEEFENKAFKVFIREIIISTVLKPLISQFSDPDVINQYLLYLCKDYVVTNKSLLNILRRTDNQDELLAFIQISKHEYKVQNAKDSGDKDEIKKYLKSILFVESVAQQKLRKLLDREEKETEFYLDQDSTDSPLCEKPGKLVSLPFDVILNNNIALHYFTQYLMNLNAEGYVFFYHNVEGFRTTVQMLKADVHPPHADSSFSENIRMLATQLYDSYLGPNVSSNIDINENILKKLKSRLKTENLAETCFDEVQEKVYDILENEFYLSGFKDSTLYIKLLAELDLLHEPSSICDSDSLSSTKSEEEEKFNCDTVVPTDEEMLNELLTAEISLPSYDFPDISSGPLLQNPKEIGLLVAEVHSTGITHHGGRTFAVYAIAVSHYGLDNSEEKWYVVRRYSEFYDFHEIITDKYPVLASFNFPSKKPFNNLTKQLMEKRRYLLNEFMQFILSSEILAVCDGLKLMIYNFLQPNLPEKGKKSFAKSVGTFVSPLKTSVKSVGQFARLVPDAFFELKDGFKKTFFRNPAVEGLAIEESSAALKDSKTDDIPFRIMLLLMDEVFNLRNKDLWFRRRIMTLLRQIIKTMQGGAINRKIREYVQGMTKPSQIAEWLKIMCQTIWPDGRLAESAPERDYHTKMRTRIVTKMFLLCAIPDELKHIIGFETSFKGAMLIFNVFQYSSLNRRLLLVIFENFLKTLFPNNKIPELLLKLHSKSSLSNTLSVSSDKLSEDQRSQEEDPITPMIHVEDTEIETPKAKSIFHGSQESIADRQCKEPKSKISLQCLSQFSIPTPKQRKRRKSESSIFYTDFPKEEDKVILPLNR